MQCMLSRVCFSLILAIAMSSQAEVTRIRACNGKTCGYGIAVHVEEGYLTAGHIVRGATKIEILGTDGQWYSAQTLRHSNDPDLALLEKRGANGGIYEIANQDPASGKSVNWYSMRNNDWARTTGKILDKTFVEELLAVDVRSYAGESGGPLFSEGSICGILMARDKSGGNPTYFQNCSSIRKFLGRRERAPIAPVAPPPPPEIGASGDPPSRWGDRDRTKEIVALRRQAAEFRKLIVSLQKRVSELENREPGSPPVEGPEGQQGPAGPSGPQGVHGVPGDRGAIGPQGATGIHGSVGHAGEKGDQGPNGQRGERGLQGSPGKDGKDGEDGKQAPPRKITIVFEDVNEKELADPVVVPADKDTLRVPIKRIIK